MGSLGDDEDNNTTKKKKNPSPSPSLVLPWKTKFAVAVASFFTDALRRPDGTLNRRIANVVNTKSPADDRHGVSSHDVHVDPTRNLWFRLYVPTSISTSTPLPVIVFFHGGGFAFLSPASRNYHAACHRFARCTPALVVSVNYRLSPEHRFPAPYDDGVDVLRFLDTTTATEEEEGLQMEAADLSRCFLAGDSAGANIAHHVARRWCTVGVGASRRVRVAGVIAIQPFFGGEGRVGSELRLWRAPLVNVERTDWLWRAFLPEGEDRDHEACNVFGPKAGAGAELGEGFPRKVMVVVGGFDPLQDWQRRYVEGLKQRGREVTLVEYPNTIHAFYLFPELPEAGLLPAEVRAFIESCPSTTTAAPPPQPTGDVTTK